MERGALWQRSACAVAAVSVMLSALALAGWWRGGSAYAAPPGSAYEKVSPADKSDGDVWFQATTIRSSVDGRRVSYQTPTGLPGDESVFAPTQHVSALEGARWNIRPIMPLQQDAGGALFLTVPIGYQSFSDDLGSGVLAQGGVPLVPGATDAVRNLYVRDFASGGYRLLTPPPLDPVNPFFGFFLAAPVTAAHTGDMRTVAFESPFRMTPDVPPLTQTCTDFGFGCVPNAYLWRDGELSLLGRLRDGSPAPNGSVVGRGVTWGPTDRSNQQAHTERAVSADGSRIYYTVPPSPPTTLGPDGIAGDLYLSDNGTRTMISASQAAQPDPEGPQSATFLTATPDGSIALFSSCEKLTDDSTAEARGAIDCSNSKLDLYRYDVESGVLTDLSASISDSVANVIGLSDDASRVYFGAEGQIYLWSDGEVVPVGDSLTTGTPSPATDIWPFIIGNAQQSVVSRDGRHLAFSTSVPQAGMSVGGTRQVYLYEADSTELRCVSCAAIGTLSDAVLRPMQVSVASVVEYQQRNIDDAGRYLFFETASALNTQDLNGQIDVYRYDIESGAIVLVSSGTGRYDAHFGDASSDGGTVFFTTRNRVIPELDRDELEDLYAARAGAPPYAPPAPAPECVGDACQGVLVTPPPGTVPGTANFSGPADDGDAGTAPVDVFSLQPLSARQRAKTAATGVLPLVVRVSSAGELSAVARATLGRRARVIARASRRVRAGGDVRLVLRLSPPARTELRRGGALRVTLVVRYSQTNGTQRATFRLQRTTERAASRMRAGARRGGLR